MKMKCVQYGKRTLPPNNQYSAPADSLSVRIVRKKWREERASREPGRLPRICKR